MIAVLRRQKNFEKRFNIKFHKPVALVHPNNFISVSVNWVNRGCLDFPKFKYVDIAHHSFGGVEIISGKKLYNVNTASFEFPSLTEEETKDMVPWFEVGLLATSKKEEQIKKLVYLFFNNLKYEIIVWFAPEGWAEWDKAITLKQYERARISTIKQ